MRPTGVAGIRPRGIVAIVALFALPLVVFLPFLLVAHHHATAPAESETWANYFLGAILTLTVITEIVGIILRGRQIIKRASDLEMMRQEIKQFAIMAVLFVATSFSLGISVGRLMIR